MFQSFIKWPKLIISAVYEKVSEKANKANTSVKKYLGDDTNIDHIAAVVYDILPFAVKVSVRYDEFNKKFHQHFKSFRDKIYSYEDSLQKDEKIQKKDIKIEKELPDTNAVLNNTVTKKEKSEKVAKKVATKTTTKAKKVVSDVSATETEKKVAKKVAAKKTTTSKTRKATPKDELPIKAKPAAMTAANKRKTEDEE